MLIRLSTGFYGISYIFHMEVFQVSPGTGFVCVCGAEHRCGGLQGFSQHRDQPRLAAQHHGVEVFRVSPGTEFSRVLRRRTLTRDLTISTVLVTSTSVCAGMAAVSRRTLWRIAYYCAPLRWFEEDFCCVAVAALDVDHGMVLAAF